MPLPDFTDDEKYLLSCIKSPNASGANSSCRFGYRLGGVVIAGFATYYASVPMILAAFAIVCGFRIYEERLQTRWLPLWRSIIAKYEASSIGTTNEIDSNPKV